MTSKVSFTSIEALTTRQLNGFAVQTVLIKLNAHENNSLGNNPSKRKT